MASGLTLGLCATSLEPRAKRISNCEYKPTQVGKFPLQRLATNRRERGAVGARAGLGPLKKKRQHCSFLSLVSETMIAIDRSHSDAHSEANVISVEVIATKYSMPKCRKLNMPRQVARGFYKNRSWGYSQMSKFRGNALSSNRPSKFLPLAPKSPKWLRSFFR